MCRQPEPGRSGTGATRAWGSQRISDVQLGVRCVQEVWSAPQALGTGGSLSSLYWANLAHCDQRPLAVEPMTSPDDATCPLQGKTLLVESCRLRRDSEVEFVSPQNRL